MITGKDIYEIAVAVFPLYFALLLAYCSVRWWNVFTPEQCAGINRFVAMYSIPFLSFDFIASNNIYNTNLQFLAADSLQKIVILLALYLWKNFSKKGSFEWMITLYSLVSLPNAIVVGVPLLGAMYGEVSANLLVQAVLTQGVIWNILAIALYECREAMLRFPQKFPDSAGSTNSDGFSLSIDDQNDGKMRGSFDSDVGSIGIHPTMSHHDRIEIYSVNSSPESTPRISSCDHGEINLKISEPKQSPKEVGMQDMDKSASNASIRGGHNEVNQINKPPTWVRTKLILIVVWRKLLTNPNTYASLLALAWSLIAFKWQIHIPRILNESILILSKTGLGMSMFSLGLFMAAQPKIINCRKSVAVFSLVVRFLIGPAVMAATAYAVGIRGVILHVVIVQAALPQAIVSFVFAKEYNLHAEILSTAVCFSTMLCLPVVLLYNVVMTL